MFEWTVIGLIVFGMVIPFWLMTYFASKTAFFRMREGGKPDSTLRYNEVMDYLHSALKRSKSEASPNGASIVATIRELKKYPEHRDLTLLYLEEITITGNSKFDELAKIEIKDIEKKFLGSKND
ncbi:MAG: hypothetical protein AAGE37_11885 [Pseudomonadota bacterium]